MSPDNSAKANNYHSPRHNWRLLFSVPATKALLVFATLVVTGCTVVPGSHISMPASAWFQKDRQEAAASVDLEFVTITPQLISRLAERPSTIEHISEEQRKSLENYEYRIGRGDILSITVYEHPELTIPAGSYRAAEEGGNQVGPDGTFFFPYAGNVEAAGTTPYQVREVLAERLSRVIENPQIDAKVVGFNSQKVYVSGEVSRPTVLPITTTPLTVIEAISQAGGLAVMADWRHLRLTRDGISRTIDLKEILEDGNWQDNLLLKGGDSLHIPRNDSQKIYVMGEVTTPQTLLLGRDSLTLAQALSDASGMDETQADPRGIFVLRHAERQTLEDGRSLLSATIYQLDASSASGFLLADQFYLQPRDIVYVSAAPVARWNRLINQLLPSIIITDQAQGIE